MHHCGLLDSMKIEVLQTQPVEAILMSILKAWRRRCHASVETFCSLCEDIRQSQVQNKNKQTNKLKIAT